MRRGLPHLVALMLGIGAALLVAACGSSTRGGIPAADASKIKAQLEDVRTSVADGNCDGLARQLREVNSAIDALPRSVNNRLVSALRDGADRLQSTAVQDCNDNAVPTQTQTTPPETATHPDTTPTQTETTPPETTTTPPKTTTQPPPTATAAPEPAPVPPPPPVVSPGGGTPPTVP